MGGVWYRARADVRRSVGATVLFTVLVGLTGGVVLTAVAGARRARNATPAFLDYSHPGNVGVFMDPPLPQPSQDRLARRLLALPQWESAGAVSQPVFTLPVQG